jgi:hypothetical protein
MKIKTFSAGELVEIQTRSGKKSRGLVVSDLRSSMYDMWNPGKSYYVYSVMIDGEVHHVPEELMKSEK